MRSKSLFIVSLLLVVALLIILASGCRAPSTPTPAPTVTTTVTRTATPTATATPAPAPTVTTTATVTATVTPTPAKTYTWKAIRGFPADSNDLAGWKEFLKRLNERAKGRLVIQDIGGEEVYPAAQQFAPVKTGTVDMVYTSAGYIGSTFPEPVALMHNFGASHAQMRSVGVVAKLDEWARKEHGVTIIGMPIFGNYVLWITKPIKTLADLKTLKVRSHSAYNPLLQPLGIPTVTVSISELYTALERGVIDGAVLGNLNLTVYGIEPIIRYRVDPPFWRAGHGPVFANLKSFEALPADLQKLLVDTMVEVENEAPAMFDALAAKENVKLKAAGIKPIRLSDEEWLQTQKIVWENGLPTALGKVSPEHKAEIMKLLSAVYPPKQPYPAVD